MSFKTVTLSFSSQPSMEARGEPPGVACLPSLLFVGSPCSIYSPVGPHCHRLAALLLGRDGPHTDVKSSPAHLSPATAFSYVGYLASRALYETTFPSVSGRLDPRPRTRPSN